MIADTAAFFDWVLGFSAHKAEDLGNLQVCARAFLVYLVLIVYVRLAKKRFLGEATAFDVILIIIIGSLSSRAISGNAPFVASLAGTLMLIALHWLISYFTESSWWLGVLTKGTDVVLIRNGRVDREALRKTHMSGEDLREDLRQQGIANPKQVKEARLERSGKVSVIRK